MSVLGSTLPLKKCFSIQGTCNKSTTVVMTLCVNVSIKSQQAMKTAMTPLSFARIRPFFSLWTKTTLMRQASQYGFPLPGGEGFIGWWILRLRLRLRAEWQGGGDSFISEWPTIRESGGLCMGDWCMLYVVVLEWCCSYWLLIDSCLW